MICGVYTITNVVAGKQYVGSSVDIERRWTEHKQALANVKHGNRYLQRAWNKYGADAFVFKVVERCEPESLLACEQTWMDIVKPFDSRGYNASKIAGKVEFTQQVRESMSKAKRGKPSSFRGRNHSPEAIAKMRQSSTGKKHTPASKAKMSTNNKGENNPFFGRKHSKDAIEKNRKAHLGMKHTKATKNKISNSHLGKKLPESAKEKLRFFHTGRNMDEATKAKISATLKARYRAEARRQSCQH